MGAFHDPLEGRPIPPGPAERLRRATRAGTYWGADPLTFLELVVQMRLTLPLLAILSATAVRPVVAQTMSPVVVDDPYIWLEEKDGAKAMEWVAVENGEDDAAAGGRSALRAASTRTRTRSRRRRTGFRIRPDVRAGVQLLARRRASARDLALDDRGELSHARSPKWTTVLDIDSLGKAEGKNWVWKGANCLKPEERLCLVGAVGGRRGCRHAARVRPRHGAVRGGRVRAAALQAGCPGSMPTRCWCRATGARAR